MTSKHCTKCKELKPLIDFSKRLNRKNKASSCKSCENQRKYKYRCTKKGLISKIYSDQKKNSIKRSHVAPEYSLKSLTEWLYSQVNFDCLYLNWINSGYSRMLTPSVDRLDDYKPYSLRNIRLVTWEVNMMKGHRDRKEGINNKMSKSVRQITFGGELIAEYHSAKQAMRLTGVSSCHIGSCRNGNRKSAGGFKWI